MGAVVDDAEGVVGLLDGPEPRHPQAVAGVLLLEDLLELAERHAELLLFSKLRLQLIERSGRALVVAPIPLEGVVVKRLPLELALEDRG
eukprot:7447180-Alexandrium_andersonii.AAC.1